MQTHSKPITFGLVAIRTELRKQAHDHHRKVALLERIHAREINQELNAWRAETKDVAKLRPE